jgi:hypothetical protein
VSGYQASAKAAHIVGSCHCDELFLQEKHQQNGSNLQKMSEAMRTVFEDFAGLWIISTIVVLVG